MCENDNKGVCCSCWLLQGRHSTSDPTLTITIYVHPSLTSTHTHARTLPHEHLSCWRTRTHARNTRQTFGRFVFGCLRAWRHRLLDSWRAADRHPTFTRHASRQCHRCARLPARVSVPRASHAFIFLLHHYLSTSEVVTGGIRAGALFFVFIFIYLFIFGGRGWFFVCMFKKIKAKLCNGQHK